MKILGFLETEKILKKYNIPLIPTYLIKTKKEAQKKAKKIGYPLVLKISSPFVFHRTEKGLVKVKIFEERTLQKNFDDLLKLSKKIKIEGILIQKMAEGIELICGMKKDNIFGPVLMFGIGGIFVEILKDISFGIVPLTKKEAKEMIKQIIGYKILKGYRGKKANIKKIEEILVNLSKLSQEHPEIQEIDLNPIFADEKKIQVVDAKIFLE